MTVFKGSKSRSCLNWAANATWVTSNVSVTLSIVFNGFLCGFSQVWPCLAWFINAGHPYSDTGWWICLQQRKIYLCLMKTYKLFVFFFLLIIFHSFSIQYYLHFKNMEALRTILVVVRRGTINFYVIKQIFLNHNWWYQNIQLAQMHNDAYWVTVNLVENSVRIKVTEFSSSVLSCSTILCQNCISNPSSMQINID